MPVLQTVRDSFQTGYCDDQKSISSDFRVVFQAVEWWPPGYSVRFQVVYGIDSTNFRIEVCFLPSSIEGQGWCLRYKKGWRLRSNDLPDSDAQIGSKVGEKLYFYVMPKEMVQWASLSLLFSLSIRALLATRLQTGRWACSCASVFINYWFD